MRSVLEFSEEEFQLWLKSQLEKREFMCGYHFSKEEMKQQIYELLFLEQKITVDDIEQYFLPFSQAGYLSPRRKFELMMFILEKDYGDASLVLNENVNQDNCIDSERVEKVYLEWVKNDYMLLTDDEKKEFFVQTLADQLGFGILEVLNRLKQDGVLIGEMCPPLYDGESAEGRIAIYRYGQIVRLPFLQINNKEELIRIIKGVIAIEKKGELTMIDPIWECVKEDGTCITAIRPPEGNDWGIRILYGASRKERRDGRDNGICRL